MKLSPFVPLSLVLTLLTPALRAESLVFEIGTFNGSTAEFEQEADPYNDPRFYVAAGDYSSVQGGSGMGEDWTGQAPEILQDGPDGLSDPQDPLSPHNWALSLAGFPRAAVPGRPVLDIFFQLSAAEAASEALLFETTLFGLGGNSSHDVTFSLNGIPFYRKLDVRADTPVKVYIPKNLPGLVLQEGGNVLTVRRTGGGPVDPGGGDNPWIQWDAMRLTAQVQAPTQLLWQVGQFDHNQAEFEAEWNDHTNPQFYVMPGDYTGVKGAAGSGGDFPGASGEIWKDPGAGTDSLDGFPRALTPGRPAVDLYFRMTAAQAQSDYLKLQTVMIFQGGNSSHNVRAYLNGTPLGEEQEITGNKQIEVVIPRRGLLGAGLGPEFRAGANVLSFVRTAGGPVDPLGPDEPWIQFDAIALSTAEAPPPGEEMRVFQEVLSVGYFDSGSGEFEQENNLFNNPQFYASAGDYSQLEGKAGFGSVREGPEPEIWQDPPMPDQPAGSNPWANSQDGFPRALVKDAWGRPVIDIFFQAQPHPLTGAYFFTAKLFGLGQDSQHDLAFFVNGQPFHTATAVDRDTFLVLPLPADILNEGANVLSLQRTGGTDTDTAWIQFDQVEIAAMAMVMVPEPQAPGSAFAVSSITRNAAGHVTLTWPSAAGQTFNVTAASSPEAVTWDPVASNVAGTAGSTTYTDEAVPAGTTRRFYRVRRLP